MIKRVTWFVAGAATGAAGAVAAGRRVRRAAEKLLPANVARSTVQSVERRRQAVVAAVREGRAAMVAKEHELRARRDGHPVVGGSLPVADPLLATGPVIDAEVRDLDAWRREAPNRGRSRGLHRHRHRA